MICKRILILQQTDPKFAERNKEICGMVKVVNSGQTNVTVFVVNADVSTFGEWWLLLSFDGSVIAQKLTTLNNFVFSLAQQNLDNVSCLLVKKEEICHEVAQAQFGPKNFCALLRRSADVFTVEEQPTDYEQFVASTQNYYQGVEVERLKAEAVQRYKVVEAYSAAFERFYATGSNVNYYQSVKNEIAKVFVQFPPYYPLIRKYSQSFFVRIDFPSSEKFFVLGILQKQGEIRYICYGLPAETEKISDKDFVFVENSPTPFWMLFQDATTGQITTIGDTV